MSKLKLVSMRDVVLEPIQWLWKPYIPLGKISIIQGDGGEGKTTLALAIAAAVSSGEALPGGGNTLPAHVIVQNAEDGVPDTIKPRLEQLWADLGKIDFIDEDESDRPLTFIDERIEEAIVRKNAKLFIFDPIQAFFGRANMNAAGSVRPIMKKLGQVASRTGCAILLVGHLGKKGGRAQYRGLGSIDIFAAARSVMTVGRLRGEENLRAMVHNKSNLAPPGVAQAFGFDPANGFTWMGEHDVTIEELLGGKAKADSQFIKAQNLIKMALAGGLMPGPTAAEDMMTMAEDEGISAKTMYRAKDALGVISVKRNNIWWWQMPVEVKHTEVAQDGQHGQDRHTQDGQEKKLTTLTNMTTFAESEAV